MACVYKFVTGYCVSLTEIGVKMPEYIPDNH